MDLEERFAEGLMIDGGLATELDRRGADLRDELWSARVLLEQPERIRDVHAAYFAAGADVAITASYQASYEGLARRGLDRIAADRLLRRSVELAREAAGDGDRLVAASVGPYGAMLADGSEYVGRYGLSVRELIEWHRPRLEALLAAEPDVFAVETIPAIEEVEAIVTLLDDVPEARAWVSCSCRDETSLSDGTPIGEAADLVSSSRQVVAFGVNCTPPGFVAALLRGAGAARPMLTYPNLGSTWDPEARAWRAEGPRPDFGALSMSWREAGARSIGGCCGTTPEDIAAIAAVDQA
jgi:homocysteine S-methyltransferase